MGENLFTGTLNDSSCFLEPLKILKVAIPKYTYKQEEQQAIYENIKEQVGKYYLPVMVLEDIQLEVIK